MSLCTGGETEAWAPAGAKVEPEERLWNSWSDDFSVARPPAPLQSHPSAST